MVNANVKLVGNNYFRDTNSSMYNFMLLKNFVVKLNPTKTAKTLEV